MGVKDIKIAYFSTEIGISSVTKIYTHPNLEVAKELVNKL